MATDKLVKLYVKYRCDGVNDFFMGLLVVRADHDNNFSVSINANKYILMKCVFKLQNKVFYTFNAFYF